MEKRLKDCEPTIMGKDTLMTNEGEFMDKEIIKNRCTECVKQEVCIRICSLLSVKKYDEALDLIPYTHAVAGKKK